MASILDRLDDGRVGDGHDGYLLRSSYARPVSVLLVPSVCTATP